MLIRQDFQQSLPMPPRMFMEQIMDHVARAYCFLWDRKNEENKVDMTWKDVSKYYNKNRFRTNIRKLNNEGLLSYEESDDGLLIELTGWDEISDLD